MKKNPTKKRRRTLPGDPKTGSREIASMIRVNHAGEYGAKRIYEGQMKALGHDPKTRKLLEHMTAQELEHLAFFEKELLERRVRPTLLHPVWHAAGFALGYVTGKIGKEAAMACTVAVESVISGHYQSQLDALPPAEKKLRASIAKFKAEEEEHHDIGLENDAENAPAYPVLSALIKAGSRLAIGIAKKI